MGFKLIIKSTEGILFQEEVLEAYFPGENGPIGIFEDYDYGIVGLAKSGVISVKTTAKTYYFAVFSGVLETNQNVVTLLSNDVENGEDVDISRAMASRDRALDRLNNPNGDIDIKRATLSLNRALARIDAKNGSLGGIKK